jgi:hypothetical protein
LAEELHERHHRHHGFGWSTSGIEARAAWRGTAETPATFMYPQVGFDLAALELTGILEVLPSDLQQLELEALGSTPAAPRPGVSAPPTAPPQAPAAPLITDAEIPEAAAALAEAYALTPEEVSRMRVLALQARQETAYYGPGEGFPGLAGAHVLARAVEEPPGGRHTLPERPGDFSVRITPMAAASEFKSLFATAGEAMIAGLRRGGGPVPNDVTVTFVSAGAAMQRPVEVASEDPQRLLVNLDVLPPATTRHDFRDALRDAVVRGGVEAFTLAAQPSPPEQRGRRLLGAARRILGGAPFWEERPHASASLTIR